AIAREGEAKAQSKLDMARVFIQSAIGGIELLARETAAAIAEGPELADLLESLADLTRYTPCDTISLRQAIAQRISEAGKYVV
ncbi:MAG TPA: acyl-CoA dehydrogenase, partial [Bacillota bacterium]|nr:acyl-CoA dehydrogenase [Bacillota bacterium]